MCRGFTPAPFRPTIRRMARRERSHTRTLLCIMGIRRTLDAASAQRLRESAAHYAANGRRYAKGLVAIG
jgi:hypothetical protein